jgi:hypothetical protein
MPRITAFALVLSAFLVGVLAGHPVFRVMGDLGIVNAEECSETGIRGGDGDD